MFFVETAAPAEPAVSLSDIKAHLRQPDSSEDALLSIYISAATNIVEVKTGRALVSRTFRYECDEFPESGTIEIPLSPLVSVQSIEYYDTSGTLQTLSDTIYTVDAVTLRGRIVRKSGESFPSVELRRPGAVRVNFTAGHGATTDSVPQGLRFVVMLLTAHMFTNRTPVSAGTMSEIPKTLQYAVDAYKIWGA